MHTGTRAYHCWTTPRLIAPPDAPSNVAIGFASISQMSATLASSYRRVASSYESTIVTSVASLLASVNLIPQGSALSYSHWFQSASPGRVSPSFPYSIIGVIPPHERKNAFKMVLKFQTNSQKHSFLN